MGKQKKRRGRRSAGRAEATPLKWPARASGVVAAVAAIAFAALLGVRTLQSPDLGYHLTYGLQGTVDYNAFLFTLPAADTPPEARPVPGPGCWYDQQGGYRFPNANWLSQVVMAGAYRWLGFDGLCLLQAALVVVVFGGLWAAMHGLGLPSAWSAAGILLAAMTAHERLGLRPEVFGYAMLVWQFAILAGASREGKRVRWPAVAALVLLQGVFVNLHSYFLLGLAVTAAALAEPALRLLWRHLMEKPRDQRTDALKHNAVLLSAAFAAQIAVCFANPWTWRLAVLPIQTLVFLREHYIAGGTLASVGHPWSYIGEFLKPFGSEDFWSMKATYAYCVLLGVAGAGALAALLKRRWMWLLVIAGMTAVSLAMRRNIAPAAFLIAPVALAGVRAATQAAAKKHAWLGGAAVRVGVSTVLALASAGLAASVVTNHFYYGERSANRFGVGISRLNTPLDAGRWVGEHLLRASASGAGERTEKIWTDYTGSSNAYFLSRLAADDASARVSVPIVTNTWAYPPSVMQEVPARSTASTW